MPHKHKIEEFEQLLCSIESGECVDTRLKLEDFGLDAEDIARLTETIRVSQQQMPETKPNNNNFPQEYLEIIRNNGTPQQQSVQPKPNQLFSFNDAVKGLRVQKQSAKSEARRNFTLGLN